MDRNPSALLPRGSLDVHRVSLVRAVAIITVGITSAPGLAPLTSAPGLDAVPSSVLQVTAELERLEELNEVRNPLNAA